VDPRHPPSEAHLRRDSRPQQLRPGRRARQCRRGRGRCRVVTVPINELTYAEQPAIEWLSALGWAHIHGPEIAPNGAEPERATWDEVVLRGRLQAALVELNPEAPRSAVELALERVRETASPDPAHDHLDFHELLLEGVPVTVLDEGDERALRLRLVD